MMVDIGVCPLCNGKLVASEMTHREAELRQSREQKSCCGVKIRELFNERQPKAYKCELCNARVIFEKTRNI